MPLRTLLVDDDAISLDLAKEICVYSPDISLVETTTDSAEVPRLVSLHRPDLLLMDVDLGDHLVFDVLDNLAFRPPTILYTSYAEHAVRAFRYEIVDFLLKPLTPEVLQEAIVRVYRLQERSGAPPRPAKRLFIRHDKIFERLDLQDIRWIEAKADKSLIQLGGEQLLVNVRMKDIAGQLSGTDVIRVHRSFLANIAHIESMEDNMLVVDGKLIPVGIKFRERLFEKLIFIR